MQYCSHLKYASNDVYHVWGLYANFVTFFKKSFFWGFTLYFTLKTIIVMWEHKIVFVLVKIKSGVCTQVTEILFFVVFSRIL